MQSSDEHRPTGPGSKLILAEHSQPLEEAADYSVDDDHDDKSLWERIEVIRRHWPIVLLVPALIVGARIWQLSKTIPVYRAQTTIRFSDNRSNLTAGVGTDDRMRMAVRYVDAMKSQVQLLASRGVAEEAVVKGMLQLRELRGTSAISSISEFEAPSVKTYKDTLRLTFRSDVVSATYGRDNAAAPYGSKLVVGPISLTVSAPPAGAQAAAFEVIPYEAAVSAMQGALQPNIRPETDIVDISFTHTDPIYAQRVVNAGTKAFQTMNFRSSQEGARARREFIQSQLKKSDSTLAIQRAQLSAFRSSSQAYSSRDKISSEQQSLAGIEMRRSELEADRQVYQSLLARAVKARDGETNGLRALISAPGIASNPVIMQLYSQMSDLVRVRDSLTSGPFPAAASNPDVQKVNAQIQSTSDELINAVKSQIEGLDARIASLNTMSQKSAAQVSALPRSEAEESRLLQEVEGTQHMVEQLQEEEQRARISEVAQGGEIEIIDLARFPGYRVIQGKSLKLSLAAVLGLLIGAGLAFLIDDMNPSFRRAEDVERVLKLPALSAIPKLDEVPSAVARALRLSRRGTPSHHAAALSGYDAATQLVTVTMPAFESFRTLRTNLIFSDAVQKIRTLVVTSAAPGDGKSTTTANLAAAFAQQGMRVLAVDCDFRRGRLHNFFGFHREPGLTNIILGEADLAQAIHETPIPNLYALTSGANPPNSTELLGSDAVRSILLQATQDFDIVVLDSPPILATADAAILSSMADGVLLIVRMGRTNRNDGRRALQRLKLVGARVLGTVLNDPDNVLGSSHEYYYEYSSERSAS